MNARFSQPIAITAVVKKKNVNLPLKTTILIKSHCFLYSDRLVRLWRVTGTLDEQLGELEGAADD